MTEKYRIILTGAGGKMGKDILAGIMKEPDIQVVGAVDFKMIGKDIGFYAGEEAINVTIQDKLEQVIIDTKPQIMIDFTNPQAVMKNIRTALSHKVASVVGTTGLTSHDVEELAELTEKHQTPVFIAPNFALGAVLMMRFAQEAGKYFPHVEVIEKHHDQKMDAPSGTALKTMEMIAESRKEMHQGASHEFEKIPGSRGGYYQGMRVHSVRLPGLIAHQEVIFGGQGQTLTIRHDSLSRDSFVPGVLLAIRNILNMKGVVYGLEKLLW
ncbi:4-hydroxy-tetrahydrodipicolinate reductase [Dehalobacterium formicoaceticum]|uniref:4-hydroxy-tetrahydrodipicolinate reductase n=1 Tax=Dehalobacterium formicoaceticum TaxID=51515 RepID=A0ABT1Y8A0_9FIRM|nr:4-hydroxy-tetrahydrodipicolinate reductase [Dehalobacterium formicoaceticum]MCR6545906.1 4-hydroxy-tetrahydrodipicolinate reductase [Dehalobacterium formicoaceticum]